ncbi:hypothetical protein RM531_08275 [Salinisphaera sp. P385]|uniref:Uncharacterized protein n=1 Tax=Spectribacter acetivorans TaxID=3075603 RepID=A0ABU3B7N1_9GAMM|nr:hypothetical protein [Salinisphaera sp. P385]MDT0618471.1 hypothetical protein [Salinisphaera sp. P385]
MHDPVLFLAKQDRRFARSIGMERVLHPRRHIPASPLIVLLEQLPMRERLLYQGVTVDRELGYRGSRRFPSAEALLKWLKPGDGESPERSWRDREFSQRLTREDLVRACAREPDPLAIEAYARRFPLYR